MTRPSGVAEGWGFGVARAPVTHEIDGNALALDEPTNSLEIVARGGGEDRRGGERHRANSQSADIRRPMAARKSERRVTTQRQRSFCEARGGNGDRGQRARSESNEGSRWGVEESRMRHARVGEGRGTRVRPRGAEIRARGPHPSWGKAMPTWSLTAGRLHRTSASRSGRERRLDDRRGDRRADTNAPVDPRRASRGASHIRGRRGGVATTRHPAARDESSRRFLDVRMAPLDVRPGLAPSDARDAERDRSNPHHIRRAGWRTCSVGVRRVSSPRFARSRAPRRGLRARVPLRRDRRSRAVFVHFSAVPVKTARRVRGNPRATPARRALVPRRCATQRTLASVDRDASARGKRTSHSRPLLARSLVRPPEPN